MNRPKKRKLLLAASLLLVVLSVVLSIISFFPGSGAGKQNTLIINNTIKLTPNETYRQGLGSFHGDENITLSISQTGSCLINFTLLTYGGPRYINASTASINYSFTATADYYEAMFQTNTATSATVHFQVFVQKPAVSYQFSWLKIPSKVLFLISWAALIVIVLEPIIKNHSYVLAQKLPSSILKRKNLKWLQLAVLLSLLFWLVLLVLNTHSLATFENWYTDSARHPYTSVLFTKVGFSVFNTPLGKLSNMDASFYKFVTWPDMPNLYPLGSILLFLPFGVLLERGISQALVFKMELVLLLLASHICLYFLLKRFWKQELHFTLKVLATYLFYVALVVYAADGQSDSIAFLFSIIGFFFFIEERYDVFLLFVAVSFFFKYQAGIFLFPFVIISLIKLFQCDFPLSIFKNKIILAAAGLTAVDLFTAVLSAPFLINVRPELIMNVANAFYPNAQIPWGLQFFAVLFILGATLVCAVYVLNNNRLVSLSMIFSLLPIFFIPYFQPWYLIYFFVYPLIPQSKLSLQATVSWLILVMLVLGFGGLSFNPFAILENIRHILNF